MVPFSNLEEEMGVEGQDWGWVIWAIEVSQMVSGRASVRTTHWCAFCPSPSQGPENASNRLCQGGSEVGKLEGWETSVVASRA